MRIMLWKKRKGGRPRVKDARLYMALYVSEMPDKTRAEQCEEIHRLSQFTKHPLKAVPPPQTLWRWLKEAQERGLTKEDGIRFHQSLEAGS